MLAKTILMLSNRYDSTEFDRRTKLHLLSRTVWSISECWIIFEILGLKWTVFYHIINNKRNSLMGHRSIPWNKAPLIPNTCISTINFMWELGLVWRGRVLLQRQNKKILLFDHDCVMKIILFFNSYVAISCMKTDQFFSLFQSVSYLCKELSICLRFGNFCVFA